MDHYSETDNFSVTEERVRASELLGQRYRIADHHWKAELILPRYYEVSQLGLRKLWKSERWVSWPEVDMQLNMERNILPVGWRVVSHLYYTQELIPLEWINELIEGNLIIFPYAVCYFQDGNDKDKICCPAFYYDAQNRVIDCKALDRWTTGSASPIAVYQQILTS
jgi:hypothetical protein